MMIDQQYRWTLEHQEALRAERLTAHVAQAGRDPQDCDVEGRHHTRTRLLTHAVARIRSSMHLPRMHGPTAHPA